MTVDPVALKAELDTDPLTRGYSGMNDEAAADSLNLTLDRPGLGGPLELRQTMLQEKKRSNDGDDTTAANLLGRVYMYANAENNSDPFGRGTPPQSNLATTHGIAAAAGLLELLRWPENSFTFLFTPTGSVWFDELLQVLVDDDVIGAPDKTAIQASLDNKRSRGEELFNERVRPADVRKARALV